MCGIRLPTSALLVVGFLIGEASFAVARFVLGTLAALFTLFLAHVVVRSVMRTAVMFVAAVMVAVMMTVVRFLEASFGISFFMFCVTAKLIVQF